MTADTSDWRDPCASAAVAVGLLLALSGGPQARPADAEIADAAIGSRIQISAWGPDGDPTFDAYTPVVAFNTVDNEFLVVWTAYPDRINALNRGQRLDATTGVAVGGDFFISNNFVVDSHGPPASHCRPAVAHNASANEYLVVSPSYYSGGYPFPEITGQRVAADGTLLGALMRLTEMTRPGWSWQAGCANVVYNPQVNEFLLVWAGRSGRLGFIGECAVDIFVQRLSAAAVPLGAATRIWGCIPILYGVLDIPLYAPPAAAFNAVTNEYLIACTNSNLIHARRINAEATAITPVDGPIGTALGGGVTAVANTRTGEYLLAWNARQEDSVQARLVSATGSVLAPITISPMPANERPALAYNAHTDEYLVAWERAVAAGSPREPQEIYGQLVSAAGVAIGRREFPISQMGAPGDTTFGAFMPAVAHRPTTDEYLVVWAGDDGTAPHVDDEFEIYGTRVVPIDPYVLGLAAHTGEGGWLQQRDDAPSFDPIAWQQVPWGVYTATGGGVYPAMGDVDGDGRDELVLGLDAGGGSWVAILDDAGHGHAVLHWVEIGWPAFGTARYPAVGNLDGDDRAEIVIGFGAGTAGWLLILDDASTGFAPLGWRQVTWAPYTQADGRTHPAIGDLTGDGIGEIVVGLGPGSAGWLQVFAGAASGFAPHAWMQVPWDPYNADNGETWPSTGDVDGDGLDEVVVGLGARSNGWLAVLDDAAHGYQLTRWLQLDWIDYSVASGETHPAVGNLDADAADEILVGLATWNGEGGWVQIFDDLIANPGSAGAAWRQVEWAAFIAEGGGTWPAIGRRRGS